MGHPTSYWNSDWAETGKVWRVVVNTIGGDIPSGASVLNLIDILARGEWPPHSYFEFLPQKLGKELDEIKTEATLADIGMRIWTENADTILEWMRSHQTQGRLGEWAPASMEVARRFWFTREDNILADYDDGELYGILKIRQDDAAYVDTWAERFKTTDMWRRRLFYTRWRLEYFWDLPIIYHLARKTWGGNPRSRIWSKDDLWFVNKYYSEQQPFLDGPSGKHGIDPFKVRPTLSEAGVGFGLDGLGYCVFVILRTAVTDFAAELINHNLFPAHKGSIQCVECARFVPHNFYGRGQQYCSEQCKKRAAKRRYRTKLRKEGRPVI